jgi:quercetin dioxygenase-like cupin family protein
MTSNTAHAAQAVIVRHEHAELLELPAAAFRLLADSGTTQGTLGANRLSLGTGADGAKPHYHARSWELFYVIDGTMEFLLDDRLSIVAPGDLVLVPPRMPHAFGATPSSTADVLVVIAPGVERCVAGTAFTHGAQYQCSNSGRFLPPSTSPRRLSMSSPTIAIPPPRTS